MGFLLPPPLALEDRKMAEVGSCLCMALHSPVQLLDFLGFSCGCSSAVDAWPAQDEFWAANTVRGSPISTRPPSSQTAWRPKEKQQVQTLPGNGRCILFPQQYRLLLLYCKNFTEEPRYLRFCFWLGVGSVPLRHEPLLEGAPIFWCL